jgi:hypothetical protein
MADQIKQNTALPQPREANRFASTNITNEIIGSLGQVFLSDGKTVRGSFVTYIANVTSNATGFGYYNATLYTRDPTVLNPTTALTSAKLAPGTGLIGYVYNPSEVGQSTHVLTDADNVAPVLFACFIVGYHTDGKPVAELIGGAYGEIVCDPPTP